MKKYSLEDLVKTVVYTGLGVAATATEKLQKTIDEMVAKGKMPAEEGKKVVEDFVKTTESRREDMEDRAKNTIKTLVDKFDFPSRKDFNSLIKRIEKLEKAARAEKSAKSTRTPSVKKSDKTAVKKASKSAKSPSKAADKTVSKAADKTEDSTK
jgi:polyhydroxyalkanoate synthesis regulator phasin